MVLVIHFWMMYLILDDSGHQTIIQFWMILVVHFWMMQTIIQFWMILVHFWMMQTIIQFWMILVVHLDDSSHPLLSKS